MASSSSCGSGNNGKSVALDMIPELASNLDFKEDLNVEEEEFVATDDPAIEEEMSFMGTKDMVESKRSSHARRSKTGDHSEVNKNKAPMIFW
ncbi:putative eukaryotic translation initiation factor eIF-5B [Dorcoceras hygrometricum]|uniref:Putative eukaryotic translation initiation factor eIF-5B n=1 Tax=Dorcoceras hygrometricum TaxID=472368 RepID=A0A2Z7B056_9LAMI|nr:putative eukaryotic translation initiation factor eIF-5B [Dorcoceras hygrometricum]